MAVTLRSVITDCATRNNSFPNATPEEVRTHSLALIVEAVETLNTVEWKTWKQPRNGDRILFTEPAEARAAELVDILLFWGNLVSLLNITPGQLEDAYHRKVAIVNARLGTDYA